MSASALKRQCRCCGRALEDERRDAALYCDGSCRAEAFRLRSELTALGRADSPTPLVEAIQTILTRTVVRHSRDRCCEACGGSLAGRRADARFCTDGCRAGAHRQKSLRAAEMAQEAGQYQ